MVGHGAYLQVYQSRTEQQKKELWDELEPEILIFDQSKKEQKIRELEIALKHNKQLEERMGEAEKRLNEFADKENDLVKAFKLLKKGYATLEGVTDGEVHLKFTDKAVEK